MNIFNTPIGKAGSDQVDAMIESAHSEIEQMFFQHAKSKTFEYGIGRTTMESDWPDSKVQLDAQRRECDARITFHAGRALELALQIIYACGTDRIMGREYPGFCEKQINADRKTHSLKKLYDRIIRELTGRNMKDALERVYQEALHRGFVDLYRGDELIWSFLRVGNAPFQEVKYARMMDGAGMTLDHSGGANGLMKVMFGGGSGVESEFNQIPDTFESFLVKADAVYYKGDSNGKRRNMRWSNYSARDHEYGRPYVIIGIEFFGRLIKGVVEFSYQEWTWHDEFYRRCHERRMYNIQRIVNVYLGQNYKKGVKLTEMKSFEEMAELYGLGEPIEPSLGLARLDSFHKRYDLKSEA